MVLAALGGASAALAQAGVVSPGGGCSVGCNYDEGGEILAQNPSSGVAPRVRTNEGGQFEFVVIGPIGELGEVRAAIEAVGGRVVRSGSLPGLGDAQVIAVFPSTAARERAIEILRERAPNSALAPHHIFSYASARLYAAGLIGDPVAGGCAAPGGMVIGMIDGPVNTAHPALAGASVRFEDLATSNRHARRDHGTGVAALLVGEDGAQGVSGFARGARLEAIGVFERRDDSDESSVELIVTALDRLVGRGVRLINMSLSGPENAALARALESAASRGVVIVAAAGNHRRPNVAWPAAAPDVIAVTAVDAARRLFRLANTGVEIEFSAPGVDVYTARESGAGYASGTSFAAPIVTALAARIMARGAQSVDAVRSALRDGVEPLGPGRRNTQFGWGLVRSGGC